MSNFQNIKWGMDARLMQCNIGDKMKEKLKKLRYHFGWTQEDLSLKIDASLNSVKNWECERSNPGIKWQKKLDDLFDKAGIV